MASDLDRRLMQQALALADNALYIATPNPRVGCVVARAERIIGRGWTHAYGGPHAEQHALADCTEDPAGATVYVTLEPCNKVGESSRAEPCVASIVRARIARVVVAATDPNPQMAGASLAMLQAHGVTVESGVCEREARDQNEGFASRMTRGRPWVRVKMAASLDGRTALADGTSQWITGAEARADGHAWRARACALLTGVGTVLQDDPQMTVRAVATPRQPRRIVVDRHGQTRSTAKIFSGTDAVWVFVAERPRERWPANVEPILLPDPNGRVDLARMMEELGRRRINELHVESGTRLAGALLADGLVDELLLYYAPCLLGDGARGMFTLKALASLDARVRLDVRTIARLGDDWRIIARVLPSGAIGGSDEKPADRQRAADRAHRALSVNRP
jgi:diaminohydroxyphosphoribosylaminopyrimidine deaminase/5-amino-6-(5-phosphoribosylamino)uracil reductase